jgi:hypothetical protein
MEKLIEELKGFEKNINEVTNEIELQYLFEKLAPAFLYGGYIKVREDYRVYIKTVEFYFHSENGNGIHDPIVYHRNGRYLEEVPYFPLMFLHAHSSGFDITFESETGKYRASALIRSYEIKNKEGEYLIWNKNTSMFAKSKEYGYNTQSTYLYTLLNGFALGSHNDIIWEDAPRDLKKVTSKPRQNVFHYDENNGGFIKTKKRCERKWSFTREERV